MSESVKAEEYFSSVFLSVRFPVIKSDNITGLKIVQI
jgi:hypothetical protein